MIKYSGLAKYHLSSVFLSKFIALSIFLVGNLQLRFKVIFLVYNGFHKAS